jgi:Flp pilus assembly protein TadG
MRRLLRRRLRHNAKGQSLVELAISIIMLVLLISGAVAFGMAYFSYVALRDAAQEGALFASFNPCVDTNGNGICDTSGTPEPVNLAGIRARIRASSTSPINFASTGVVPDSYINAVATTGLACEGISGGASNAVRVTVEYDYPIFVPLVGAIIGSQEIHLTAVVTDTILEPRCP